MWDSYVLLIAPSMFIMTVLVYVGVSCLAHCIFYVHYASACRFWSQLSSSLHLSLSFCQCLWIRESVVLLIASFI